MNRLAEGRWASIGVRRGGRPAGILACAVMLAVWGVLVGLPQGSGAEPGRVVKSFPAPGPSPRDLAWDGARLWVVDDSTDTVYGMDPSDGRVLASFAAGDVRPAGLTWDGTHLWISLDGSSSLHRIDLAGSSLAAVDAPPLHTAGRRPCLSGLAWDGGFLWCGQVAGWSSRMVQVDPRDGSVVRFHFTKGVPRGLATDGVLLWSVTDNGGLRSGIVYAYRFSDGRYVSQFDTPGETPAGLAFDGRCLWSADRGTGGIYRLEVE